MSTASSDTEGAERADERPDPRWPSRAEYAVHLVVFTVLCVVVRTHFSGLPTTVMWVRGALALAVLWFLYGLVRARPPMGPTWPGRLLRLLYWTPISLALLEIAVSTALSLMLFVMSMTAVILIGSYLPVSWLTGLALAWRRHLPPAVARLNITLSGFLFVIAQPVVSHIAWSPPAAEVCNGVAEHPHVDRLTSQSLTDNLSQPYEIQWIPERDILVGAFKMAGNSTLPYWNVPEANEVVFVDLSDEDSPETIYFDPDGEPMPQYMAVHPSNDRLAINYHGLGKDRLEILDISDLQDVEVLQRQSLPTPVNDMIALPGGDLFTMFWFGRPAVDILQWDDLKMLRRVSYGHIKLRSVYTMDVTSIPGTHRVYASLANGPVVELTIERSGDTPWWMAEIPQRIGKAPAKMGNLGVDEELGLLARGGMIFPGVQLIDLETLELERAIPVDYRSRPMGFYAERRLLLVGEWLDGTIHLYDLDEGWRPTSLPTGPYLRDMAFDEARGDVYAASKCGLYRIDLDAHLDEHASSERARGSGGSRGRPARSGASVEALAAEASADGTERSP